MRKNLSNFTFDLFWDYWGLLEDKWRPFEDVVGDLFEDVVGDLFEDVVGDFFEDVVGDLFEDVVGDFFEDVVWDYRDAFKDVVY